MEGLYIMSISHLRRTKYVGTLGVSFSRLFSSPEVVLGTGFFWHTLGLDSWKAKPRNGKPSMVPSKLGLTAADRSQL